MWDSGLRRRSDIVVSAQEAFAAWTTQHELLPLDQLAKELGVHIRTLQAAARNGRLEAKFGVRSTFWPADSIRLARRG
jgi:hypothetical protein